MTEPQSGEPDKGKKVLFGVGEPLVMMGVTSDKGSGSFSAAEYLLDAMNFGAIREWMHVTDILDSPSSPDVIRSFVVVIEYFPEDSSSDFSCAFWCRILGRISRNS